MTKLSISILGCGWLGLALAKQLHTQGYLVKGSTTHEKKTEKLSKYGIIPYLLRFNPLAEQKTGDFFDTSFLVINTPPKVRFHGEHYHKEQLEAILGHLPPSQKIIYISATSVYPDKAGIWEEHYEPNKYNTGNRSLWAAEQEVKNSKYEYCILRAGGLFGADRMLGKYMAGKTIGNGRDPVNYIHREDIVNAIETVIEQWEKAKNQIFNLVASEHPAKQLVAEKNIRDFQLEAAQFVNNDPIKNRIISGQKFIDTMGFRFRFPNPIDFTYEEE